MFALRNIYGLCGKRRFGFNSIIIPCLTTVTCDFDDDFTLMPNQRARTVPTKWVDSVTKLAEFTTDLDIDASKIWFNNNHTDLENPESGFDATLTKVNAKVITSVLT